MDWDTARLPPSLQALWPSSGAPTQSAGLSANAEKALCELGQGGHHASGPDGDFRSGGRAHEAFAEIRTRGQPQAQSMWAPPAPLRVALPPTIPLLGRGVPGPQERSGAGRGDCCAGRFLITGCAQSGQPPSDRPVGRLLGGGTRGEQQTGTPTPGRGGARGTAARMFQFRGRGAGRGPPRSRRPPCPVAPALEGRGAVADGEVRGLGHAVSEGQSSAPRRPCPVDSSQ